MTTNGSAPGRATVAGRRATPCATSQVIIAKVATAETATRSATTQVIIAKSPAAETATAAEVTRATETTT